MLGSWFDLGFNDLEIHTGMLNQSNFSSPGLQLLSFAAQENFAINSHYVKIAFFVSAFIFMA